MISVLERVKNIKKRLCNYFFENFNIYKDLRSKYYINKARKTNHHNNLIRVAFLVQMPEVWDKQILLYNELENDKRFETQMVVIPEYDYINKCVKNDYNNNYFFEHYPNAIKAFENGSWIDLKSIEPDYVFFQRPYDTYLPKGFKSDDVVKYSKCCYVPYAFWPLKDFLCGYNKHFFRNVYFAFMESKENAKVIAKKERDNTRILFCGYPSLDVHKASENKSKQKLILWTPRWTYNESVGGSHFFEYKDKILSLTNEYLDYKVVIRPHPLAFENYISTGLMKKKEVDLYKLKVNKLGAEFDKNMLIEDTFKNTAILITDISSIVYTYFLTCKPIIFCDTQIGYSPSFKSLLDGMYIADSWDDINKYIKMLSLGNDPLEQKRKEISDNLKLENVNAVINISNKIIEDYYGGK